MQKFRTLFDRAEGWFLALILAVMAILPLAEIVARRFGGGLTSAGPIVQHLTLWIAFLGAALAASEGKLLALATGNFLPQGKFRNAADVFAAFVGTAVCALLAAASWEFILLEKEAETEIALGIGLWITLLALPIAFALIALRLAWKSSDAWLGRGLALLGLAAGAAVAHHAEWFADKPAWPALAVLIAATLLGGPIFVVLGGAAIFLFLSDWVPMAAVPVETYQLSVSPTLPAIPLFTLAGFLLAEGKASQRLVGVFRAFFGWIPGGTAVATAVVCAFFTVFTGGSGVTILALGGLLFQALQAEKYRENFSLGLLTASGSLGLLLPPALPLIVYGIIAQVSITDLFIGGIFPGILLIGLLAAWGVREGLKSGQRMQKFDWQQARAALWLGKWELMMPVVVLVAIFSGWATLVEASAIAVLYAAVAQILVHKDLPYSGVPRVLRECAVLMGGVLIILGVAKGLTNYMVDAMIPDQLLGLVQEHVESKWAFLLMLNIFLLLVGCMMDIFSAIVVVVPLIIPLGAAFGIDPIHLGIIFIANLELGYLTPPVGLNLFLASYRFERPLLKIYKAAVPMLVILGIGVLLITYVPWLTTGIFGLLGR